MKLKFLSLLCTCLLLVTTGQALSLDIATEIAKAKTIEAVQPPGELIEMIEQRPRLGDPGVSTMSSFDKEDMPYQISAALIKDHLPFYPYYALKDDANHVLHPMALGRFLKRNATGNKVESILNAAIGVAYELPNGGLAWYYPRYYNVARMLGDHLKYSSISQGTILSGLTEIAEQNDSIDFGYAGKAYMAMLWPFERGGVNLANRAVLEMPSFESAPEIILNGWIDALLHIRDYAETTGNEEAMGFFRENIRFLVKILPVFDAPEAGISRYSDSSPYRVKVTLSKPEDVETLQVLYRPIFEGLPTIHVPLRRTRDQDDFSPYNNQIFRQSGKRAHVWITCSQLYETVLISSSDTMRVEFDAGTLSRRQSTPGRGGETVVINGESSGDLRYVTLGPERGMVCGYPTNFLKGGKKNYYHVYHIVGLMLLALGDGVDPGQRTELIEQSLAWLDDMRDIEQREGLEFHPLQDMLRDINANRSIVTFTDFAQLLDDAKAASVR